jgi:hypothetical protein
MLLDGGHGADAVRWSSVSLRRNGSADRVTVKSALRLHAWSFQGHLGSSDPHTAPMLDEEDEVANKAAGVSFRAC